MTGQLESAPPYSQQAVHLVRTATLTNLTLSQMADQKASILMGATFVVFTLAVGQASRGTFPLALLVLALFSFLSAICAVAVVMPSIRTSRTPPGSENLMFFGVFSQMDEEEFTEQMLQRLANDEQLYRAMLRDIHQNGVVLQNKKYRFLGLAYRLFLAGLVLTLATFLFESRTVLAGMF